MQKLIALLLMLGVSPMLAAKETQYIIDSRHTFPAFEISHLGFSLQRGRFNKTTGTVAWDKDAGVGKVNIEVEAASISTGLKELEDHLKNEDFFDVARYPKITFSSDKLVFKDKKLQSLTGTLTMHGKSKMINLQATHFHCGIHFKLLKEVCGANLVGTIKRSDFGVDKYAPALANDVKLMIQVEAIKQ